MIVQFLEIEKLRVLNLILACGDAVFRWNSTPGAWRGGAGAWPPPWSTSPTRTRPHSRASRPEAPGLQENFQKLHLLDKAMFRSKTMAMSLIGSPNPKEAKVPTYIRWYWYQNCSWSIVNICLQCQTPKLIYCWHPCEYAYLKTGSFYKVTENPACPAGPGTLEEKSGWYNAYISQ